MIENLFIGYVNLDDRIDRFVHIKSQLAKVELEATRFRGMLPHEYDGPEEKVTVMRKRSPGAIGCHFSQVRIMLEADHVGMNAMVLEDDVVFCKDFRARMEYIDKFCQTHLWDIIWLGATVHINPPHWHTGRHPDLPMIYALGRDAELTDDPRMLRTYGCFSTYAYIVNKDSIIKILNMLDSVVHLSMGIDWAMIKIQPQLLTYCFVPGCVKQMDNPSDIGPRLKNGKRSMTMFSGFSKLNNTTEKSKYWYQENMNDFDPLTFKWAEVAKK